MAFSLQDKTVFITGANRGIGQGFVTTLLEGGVKRIYACARNPDDLDKLVAMNPQVIEAIQLDITDSQQIIQTTAGIASLDILINNAGIVNGVLSSDENAAAIARAEMEVHLFGPMQLTQALLPLLKNADQAAIINISSIAGISNFPSIGPYSVSKAAMHSYTQGLRADLSQTGIRVIGVYPGPHDTRMSEDMEMEKPAPDNVAIKTFAGLEQGEDSIFPDDFSSGMYATFLEHPQKLEQLFTEMTQTEEA
ncbi:MAG: SDR family NAD(P)-dependent oxidoreductase [Pseudomonadales bacterium]|nr:SDR family NAD(P)-dependent oxidoreductase [Pseudomonadales bacterium]